MDRRMMSLVGAVLLLALAPGAGAKDEPGTDANDRLTITLPPPDAARLPDTVGLPSGTRIAWVEDAALEAPTIHVSETDGTGDIGPLVEGTMPSWAPDGRRFAYGCPTTDEEGFPGAICVHKLGRDVGDAVAVKRAWRPRWSPAGDAIAFSRSVVDLGDAWVRDLESGKTTRLPGGEPEWSPTGEWLLVLEEDVDDLAVAAAVVRPDGSDERVLGSGWNATWSPDGRKVASTWTEGGVTTVSAVDTESGETVELFAVEGAIADLRWLPGDTVAFVRGGHDGGDLYAIDLADRLVTSLTADLMVKADLAVSPGGDWLAFSATPTDVAAAETTGVYLASRDGGWRPLVTGVDASMPAWVADETAGATPAGPAVGLAWQRVGDRDLVSYPRNGNMYGVMAGGPGAIAWGQVYATGPRIWTTADGLDWTPADVETPADGSPEYPGEVLAVTGGDPTFVAVGTYVPEGQDAVPLVWTSSDGLTWRLIPDDSPFAGAWVTELAAWNGGFIAYGHQNISWDEAGPPRTWTSGDGATWSEVSLVLPPGAERVGSITPATDRLSGLASYPAPSPEERTRLRRVSSPDGVNWTTSPPPRIGSIETLHPLPDGLYLTVVRAKRPRDHTTLGVYRSEDSRTWTPLAAGRSLGNEVVAVGDTLVTVGSKGNCGPWEGRCVAAAWRSPDGGATWHRVPVSGTPRWATRAWMTQAAALPDGTLVAVGTELKGGEPSSAAWVSVPVEG